MTSSVDTRYDAIVTATFECPNKYTNLETRLQNVLNKLVHGTMRLRPKLGKCKQIIDAYYEDGESRL